MLNIFNFIGYGIGILLMIIALIMFIRDMRECKYNFVVIICMVTIIVLAGSEIL